MIKAKFSERPHSFPGVFAYTGLALIQAKSGRYSDWLDLSAAFHFLQPSVMTAWRILYFAWLH
jgi:hypothetical protein